MTQLTLHPIWENHPHGNLARIAVSQEGAPRRVALRKLATALGLNPLGWADDRLEALLVNGPEGPATSINVTQVTQSVDELVIRRIAREEAEACAQARIFRVIVETENGGQEIKFEGLAHECTEDVLIHLSCKSGKPVLLVGPAGSGKTTCAEICAAALNREFYFSGAVTQKSDLFGYYLPGTGVLVRTQFRDAFEHGGLFLFDEVDGSDANVLLSFNQALENGRCDFPDGRVKAHPNFVVLAAANTYGKGKDRKYVGRNKLDAAFLNRFKVLDFDYDEKLERTIANDDEWTDIVQAIRAAVLRLGVEVLVTPRASYGGAELIVEYIAHGRSREVATRKALSSCVWQGASDDTIRSVLVEAGLRKLAA